MAQDRAGKRVAAAAKGEKAWLLAGRIALAALAALLCLTFLHYGVTWDEEHSRVNGVGFLRWYLSGFQDHALLDENNQKYYGSFYNAVGVLLGRVSPLGRYETHHLLNAATAWVGLFLTWRLGTLLSGGLAGLVSLLALALTPAYYGHAFANPKDVPFAVLYLAILYLLLASYATLPRLSGKRALGLGLVIGLAMGIRVGAAMTLGYFFVLASAKGLAAFGRGKKGPPDR